MREDVLKIFVMIFGFMAVYSFFKKDEAPQYNVNISSQVQASDGLNLKAVGELIKKSKDAEELEKLLNDPSTGINNLDLNQDKKVDFIKVTEFGDDKSKGFSLSVDLAPGDTQEVATIQVEKKGEGANVQVTGNEQIYGRGHHYHSYFPSVGSILLFSYLFRPHPFYYSPWGFGYYPSFYSPYYVSPMRTYRSRVNNYTRNSNLTRTSSSKLTRNLKSPNSGKSSSRVRAGLKSPTKSQRSFQTRTRSKSVRRGGFGRRSYGSRPTRSVRRSSFGRSRSFSFGGK